jgi:hypothetical protein
MWQMPSEQTIQRGSAKTIQRGSATSTAVPLPALLVCEKEGQGKLQTKHASVSTTQELSKPRHSLGRILPTPPPPPLTTPVNEDSRDIWKDGGSRNGEAGEKDLGFLVLTQTQTQTQTWR